MTLTVREAAATYERAMRNVLPAGVGVCELCHTFIDPVYNRCYKCASQPDMLTAVVPITYSEHLGQVHTALRSYKEPNPLQVQHYAMVRLASILWLFLEEHERCAAAAADARSDRFDVVVTVPSSTPERDASRDHFRWIVGEGCEPTAERYQRLLEPTGWCQVAANSTRTDSEPPTPLTGSTSCWSMTHGPRAVTLSRPQLRCSTPAPARSGS